MKNPVKRAVIKLGGSVITIKSAAKPTIRRKALERIGVEIAAALPERTVIVHGAGSFGHTIVRRTGIDRGIEGKAGLHHWAEAQLGQNFLNVELTRILIAAGIPAFACQPTGMVLLRRGKLGRFETEPLAGLLSLGLVPVLFGVPAYDEKKGCSILSGDLLAPAVAYQLGIKFVICATDVDGVFDRDPHLHSGACRIDVIDRHNWNRVRDLLGGSRSVDVTGGMRGKITELVAWARRGIRSRIIDASIPGRLAETLRGKEAGTLVTW